MSKGGRCFGEEGTLLGDYHDREWGRPVTTERGLYERLCLELFQSGLSWHIVLHKREAMRAAFAGFDPDRVAAFGEADVARALANPGIIRNRAKVQAVVANARTVLALRAAGVALAELIWSFRPAVGTAPSPAGAEWGEMPANTPASAAMAKELKSRGFRFVGPTAAYALMQAAGLVNDHFAACPVREEVQREQEAAAKRFGHGWSG